MLNLHQLKIFWTVANSPSLNAVTRLASSPLDLTRGVAIRPYAPGTRRRNVAVASAVVAAAKLR